MSDEAFRQYAAAERKGERAAKARRRELERLAKEQAKLSALDQAKLEVEAFENQIELLLSIHRECGPEWDWCGVSSSLPPFPPQRGTRNETRAICFARLQNLFQVTPEFAALTNVNRGREEDDLEFSEALAVYREEHTKWQKLKALGDQILRRDHKAFIEALTEVNPFVEISVLGSSLHFLVHDSDSVECLVQVNGAEVIPREAKSLTSSGKLSVKAMPKGKFHELYQDYVCGCVLRVAREVFALLPVQRVLITAGIHQSGEKNPTAAIPVLSVSIRRRDLAMVSFEKLDASEAVERFIYRGAFKRTKALGAFEGISPLSWSDIPVETETKRELDDWTTKARQLADEFQQKLLARKSATAGLPVEVGI